MEKKAPEVIINADDFCLSPGVTAGILYAHQYGVISSTTAMMNTEYAKESLTEAKQYPDLGLGLHFVLDAGHPVFSSNSSLTDRTGRFLKGKSLMESAEKQDLKDELEAQLELLYKWYGNVTHIDSHHHMHLHMPGVTEVVLEIAEQCQIPIRKFSETEIRKDVSSIDFFCKKFYGEKHVSIENLLGILSRLESGVTEIMCHPAFMDSWLRDKSSYNNTRMKELEVLTNTRVKEWLKNHSLNLIHYGGLSHEC